MDKPRIVGGDEGDFRHYQRAFDFGFVWNSQHKLRRRFMDCFMKSIEPKATDLVLDLGVSDLPEPLENIFEYYYPYEDRIVAAGTEDCSFLVHANPGFEIFSSSSGGEAAF